MQLETKSVFIDCDLTLTPQPSSQNLNQGCSEGTYIRKMRSVGQAVHGLESRLMKEVKTLTHDLHLDSKTLRSLCHLDIVVMYSHAENEVNRSSNSK